MENEKIILQEAVPFDSLSPYILVKDIRFGTDIDKIQDDQGKTITSKRPRLIIYYSENSTFLEDYPYLKINKIDTRTVIIPTTKIPRSFLTTNIQKNYMEYGLRSITDRQKIHKMDAILDLSNFMSSVETQLHLKHYRQRGYIIVNDILQRLCGQYADFDKILLYSIDLEKPMPRSIMDRKIFPILMSIKEEAFPFDDMLLFTRSEKKSGYRLLMKDKIYNFNRMNQVMRSIIPKKKSNEIESDNEAIVDKITQKVAGLVSDENKEKMKQVVSNFLNKAPDVADELMFNEIDEEAAKKVVLAAVVHQTTGSIEAAKKEVHQLPSEKRGSAIKVLDKTLMDELLPHSKPQNTTTNVLTKEYDISKMIDYKSPTHLFEKRKVDFKINLEKDLNNAFKVLSTKDVPLHVQKVVIEPKYKKNGELEPSKVSTIMATLRDPFGKDHVVNIDIPTLDPDTGTFTVNGRRKCLINQIILCPITFPKINDSKFESSYSSFHIWSKVLRTKKYLEIYIASYANKIPMAIFLGFSFGFDNSMKQYGIKYEITTDKPNKDSLFSKINDEEYIVFDNVDTELKRQIVNSFILADISKYKVEKDFGTIDYFNDVIVELTGRVNSTYLIRSNLENIVDPVAKQVLINMNLPSQLPGIVQYMCENVITERKDDRNNIGNQRIRGSEIIVHLLQKQILAAYTTYKEQVLSGNQDAVFKIPQNKTLSDFINSEIVADMEYSNPVEEMATLTRISPVGKTIGGIPDPGAIVAQARNVHTSYFGNIDPVDTPEGGTIGILQQLTVDSQVSSARGLFKVREMSNDVRSGMLSATSSLIPFVENNEGARIMMACAQAKQALPLKNPQPPIIQSGYESILPSVLSDHFVKKAPINGKISNITDGYITIETPDHKFKKISIEPAHLRSGTGKDTLSVFKPIVHIGQNVKQKDIIAEGSCVSMGSIAMGATLCTAIMSYKGYNFEDGIVISESLAASEKMTSLHGISEEVILNKTDRLLDMVKIGEYVERGKPLLRKTIGELEELLGVPEEGSEMAGGQLIKKSPGGKVVDIEVFCNLPRSLFPQLSLLIDKTDKKYGIDSREKYTIRGKVIDGVMIRFEVQQELKTKLGDKLANRYGAKGIVSLVEQDKYMPVTPWGDRVEIITNPIGILNRMNIGQMYEIFTGLVSRHLALKIAQIRDKNKIIETIYKTLSLLDTSQNKEYTKIYAKGLASMSDTKFRDYYDQIIKTGFVPIIIPPFKAPSYEMILQAIKMVGAKPAYYLHLPEFSVNTYRPVGCGYMYFQKLEHMSDMKIHSRSVGPTVSKTLQPTGGKSREGGQRVGELDTFALISYDCMHILGELFGPMSDDHVSKGEMISDIIAKGQTDYRQPRRAPALDLLDSYFKALMLSD